MCVCVMNGRRMVVSNEQTIREKECDFASSERKAAGLLERLDKLERDSKVTEDRLLSRLNELTRTVE